MNRYYAVLYVHGGKPEIYSFSDQAWRDDYCASNPAFIPITSEAAHSLANKYQITL